MKFNNILVSKSNVYIKILENESEKNKMIKKRQFASFCDKYSKKIAPFRVKTDMLCFLYSSTQYV